MMVLIQILEFMMSIVKTTLSLTDIDRKWIDTVIASGEYVSNSEYIRSLIKEDRKKHSKIEYIRTKLDEAEKMGFTSQTKEEIRAEFKQRLKDSGEL